VRARKSQLQGQRTAELEKIEKVRDYLQKVREQHRPVVDPEKRR
jgi:hypothetical protein